MKNHDELAGIAERYANTARETISNETLPHNATFEDKLRFSTAFSLASIAASLAAERVRNLP
ncbi:hypothetical protein [Mycobacteroides chelonae]|uniref:hypothetical protein n=1 Tax=Mycobacteroides chelonae TaxID=1774 RepID=UPI0018B0CDEC|nr:hypothetical protein [Mycobacteroides chelonae]MBF9315851.1 hypothetical protein [Mycobacteroides chelonae]